MAGIISGFLDGAGRAAAEYGRMSLADQIRKEGEEANSLRDKELSKMKQDFTTSERVASQEFTASQTDKKLKSAETISETKDKNKSFKPTNQMKNVDALKKQGYPDDVANAVGQGAFKQIKDDNSGDMVLINTLTGKEAGRLTSDNVGNKKWLPTGEQPEQAKVTKANRLAAKSAAKEKDTIGLSFNNDKEDFPSTGGDRKQWEKEEAQRLANEERAKKKKGGGLISGQMKTKSDLTLPGGEAINAPTATSKTIQGKSISKEQYISAMLKKYPNKQKEIEAKWNSY